MAGILAAERSVHERANAAVAVLRRGRVDYLTCWNDMRAFTEHRHDATADEIWLVEHTPVLTLGLAGKAEHVLAPGDIPVVRCDRGGQVTYHGPGQVVAYTLIDLKRRALTVRGLVQRLEQAVIDVLSRYGVEGQRSAGAPGVYVAGAKVAALGLRIVRGCSYHGLALNVDMDLEPFARINPCGYMGMRVTQTRDLGVEAGTDALSAELGRALSAQIGRGT